jgi:hypothetical protein
LTLTRTVNRQSLAFFHQHFTHVLGLRRHVGAVGEKKIVLGTRAVEEVGTDESSDSSQHALANRLTQLKHAARHPLALVAHAVAATRLLPALIRKPSFALSIHILDVPHRH